MKRSKSANQNLKLNPKFYQDEEDQIGVTLDLIEDP